VGSLPVYQLVEIAASTACGFILHQQRQTAFVEFFQPFIPFNMLKGLLSAIAWKIETDHTYVFTASGAADASRTGLAFFCPLPDLVMIGQYARSGG